MEYNNDVEGSALTQHFEIAQVSTDRIRGELV